MCPANKPRAHARPPSIFITPLQSAALKRAGATHDTSSWLCRQLASWHQFTATAGVPAVPHRRRVLNVVYSRAAGQGADGAVQPLCNQLAEQRRQQAGSQRWLPHSRRRRQQRMAAAWQAHARASSHSSCRSPLKSQRSMALRGEPVVDSHSCASAGRGEGRAQNVARPAVASGAASQAARRPVLARSCEVHLPLPCLPHLSLPPSFAPPPRANLEQFP